MQKTEKISVTCDVEYVQSSGDKPACTLLLHGFMQTANRFAKQVEQPLKSRNKQFLSLQAPYPVYKQLPDRYQVGYSWYFFDPISKQHIVSKETATRFVKECLKHLDLRESIETIVSFSQGAHLAPHVARVLPNVKKVIGIGGRYYARDFDTAPNFSLIQIHGEKDQVVDVEEPTRQHEELLSRGIPSHISLLPGVGHEINDAVRTELNNQLG